MSWGAVSTSAADLHLDHRIAEAEIACKTAKDRGRGRVEVYQDTDQSMIRRHDEIGLIGSVREALRLRAHRGVRAAHHAADQPQRCRPPTSCWCASSTARATWSRRPTSCRRRRATRSFRRSTARCASAPSSSSARTPRRAGPLRVSINLSGPTLSDPDFLEWLLSAMAKYGIDGTCLVFEITEAAAAANLAAGAAVHPPPDQPRRALRARRFRHGRELAGLSQESRDQHHQARRLVRARRADQHALAGAGARHRAARRRHGHHHRGRVRRIERRARPAGGARHPVRPGLCARPSGSARRRASPRWPIARRKAASARSPRARRSPRRPAFRSCSSTRKMGTVLFASKRAPQFRPFEARAE